MSDTDENEGLPISKSESVSDVDSEEMARLMADIDDIDIKKTKENKAGVRLDEVKSASSDHITKEKIKEPLTTDQGQKEKSTSVVDTNPSSIVQSNVDNLLTNEPKKISLQTTEENKSIKKDIKSGRKVKEVSFGDDDHILLDKKESPRPKKDKNFLNSLFGDSPEKSKKSEEFVLPDKYKSPPKKDTMNDDFFSKGSPRRRRPSSGKPLFIDDEDILGPSRNKPVKKTSNQDDWLFSDVPKTRSQKAAENIPVVSPVAKKSPQKVFFDTAKTSPSSSKFVSQPPKSPAVESSAAGFNQPNSLKSQNNDGQFDFASVLHAQQQQMEAQMMHHFQMQLQEQQNKMMNLMMQQKPFSSNALQSFAVEDEEAIIKLKIDKHKAVTQYDKMEADLKLCKNQHAEEIALLEAAHKKKMDMQKEVYAATEALAQEERENFIRLHETKLNELKKEKDAVVSSYEAKISLMKSDWVENLARTKELYGGVIERMKKEHQNAIDRLTELKDHELQAVISATSKSKEVESVFELLESNTANLSQLTLSIQERNESALDLNKRALQLKEKQLKDLEAQLGASRAEAESERNRLSVLVNRLESNLSNQGTEIETDKWKMSQERMKFEIEKKAFAEEQKLIQMRLESEKRGINEAKEALWVEQKQMVHVMVQQKSELAAFQSKIDTDNIDKSELEANVTHLNEKKKILEERILNLKFQKEEFIQEELLIEEKKKKLQEEHEKLFVAKQVVERDQENFATKMQELTLKEDKLENLRRENQRTLSQITSATENLYHKENSLKKLRSTVQMEEQEAMQFINRGLCPKCKENAVKYSLKKESNAIGDNSSLPFVGWSNKRSEPASVLERLRIARQEETAQRAQNQQMIARLDGLS